MSESGARAAIRLLQDAAERGEIDPWDVDVIAVIDGFLDQLRTRLEAPRLVAGSGGSYEQDLADSSEAFLAASVLVGLKAEVLEASTFPPEPLLEEEFEADSGDWEDDQDDLPRLPARPERHLRRRPVAPPPLQRPVTLGELIRQLEDIAERLEQEEGRDRPKPKGRRYSDRAAIAQVTALAHREKLPETTAALGRFLQQQEDGGSWRDFEELVLTWRSLLQREGSEEELDGDRVGVFWALLFLCSQGTVELEQEGGLYAPLRLRRPHAMEEQPSPPAPRAVAAGVSLPPMPRRSNAGAQGSDGGPARRSLAA